MVMTDHSFLALDPSGFHRIHYTEWGDPASDHVVICVHGLTRNCRDFDFLAMALEKNCRVICMDVAGRGQSEWLDTPEAYGYPQYLADAAALLARITAPFCDGGLAGFLRRLTHGRRKVTIDWVGTSMGGLIGMILASRRNHPIRRLVLNDVGPLISGAALRRISDYVGKDPRFRSYEELEAYIRQVSKPFGALTDAQWRHLTVHSMRRLEDGSFGLVYDPAIGTAFRNGPLDDVDLWPMWDALKCEILVLRGTESDLLPHEVAQQMQQRGPGARVVEFPGIGHAPALMAEDQIKVVREFILS